MTEYIWINKTLGFGFASVKREGRKLTPDQFIYMNGRYPNPSFYTKDELKELTAEGWRYEALHSTRLPS